MRRKVRLEWDVAPDREAIQPDNVTCRSTADYPLLPKSILKMFDQVQARAWPVQAVVTGIHGDGRVKLVVAIIPPLAHLLNANDREQRSQISRLLDVYNLSVVNKDRRHKVPVELRKRFSRCLRGRPKMTAYSVKCNGGPWIIEEHSGVMGLMNEHQVGSQALRVGDVVDVLVEKVTATHIECSARARQRQLQVLVLASRYAPGTSVGGIKPRLVDGSWVVDLVGAAGLTAQVVPDARLSSAFAEGHLWDFKVVEAESSSQGAKVRVALMTKQDLEVEEEKVRAGVSALMKNPQFVERMRLRNKS